MLKRIPKKTRPLPLNTSMKLGSLKPGMRAVVSKLHLDGLLYRRLLDLGFVMDARVESVMTGPAGDPVIYQVRESQVALRKTDADMVCVHRATGNVHRGSELDHRLRPRAAGVENKRISSIKPEAVSEKSGYSIALAGNPNTGKSTIFNALTGLRQHVGNWPGKTVARAEGRCRHRGRILRLIDLPGTYSLISNSIEEEIARDFIVFGEPDCTVVVADGTCLERNLNLVLQILQVTGRVVVCVNLLDEARRKGIEVDTAALSEHLGVPVVGTEARRGKGLEKLKETVYQVAEGAIAVHPIELHYDGALEQAISDLTAYVERALPDAPNPRWIAMRLIDGGDKRLEEEVAAGLLSDRSGRFGSRSLPAGMAPDHRVRKVVIGQPKEVSNR